MHTALRLMIITVALLISGCGGNGDREKNNSLKVGVSAGPEFAVAQAAQKEALEKYGLEVSLVAFNDYVVPNEALHNGDIDVNAFQHKPYLDEQSRQRGYKLAIVGKTFIFPIAAYARKIKDIASLAPGSTVAIPNDPTNGGRALLLLQKAGLLTLRPEAGLLPKLIDITANPRQLKLLELEAPQLPRVLDDDLVALAVINNTFAAQAGLIPGRDGLLVEDRESPYVNLIVSREDNQADPKVKQFVQAYQSAAVERAAEKEFKGGAVKGW